MNTNALVEMVIILVRFRFSPKATTISRVAPIQLAFGLFSLLLDFPTCVGRTLVPGHQIPAGHGDKLVIQLPTLSVLISSRAYLFQHLIKQGALADKDAYLQTHLLLPLTYINTTQIANSTNVSNDRVPRMRFCSILLNLMK
jgi:hypothetical protein